MAQKILVVDSDDSILGMLNEVLTDEGYDVRTANPGNAAQHAPSFQPDLIVMVVLIPEIENQRRRKPTAPAIPIILMTASHQQKSPSAPTIVVDFIFKPFDLDVLLAKISSVLAASGAQPPVVAYAHGGETDGTRRARI